MWLHKLWWITNLWKWNPMVSPKMFLFCQEDEKSFNHKWSTFAWQVNWIFTQLITYYISHTMYTILMYFWFEIAKTPPIFYWLHLQCCTVNYNQKKVQFREVRSCTIYICYKVRLKRLFLEKIYLHYLLQSFSVFSLTLQYCEKLSCTRRQSSSLRYYVVVTYI